MSSTTATLALLREAAVSAPSSLARVAAYLLDSPAERASETIGAIARASETSPATVTRLARHVGLDGYKDLRVALAAASAEEQADGVLPGIAWSDSTDDVVHKLMSQDVSTLRETSRLMDTQALAAAAAVLARAPRVLVFGVGASGLVGIDLASKLARVGILAHVCADRHEVLSLGATLDDADAVIFISHSGTTVDVLEAARGIRSRAASVCVVSRTATPLADVCDVVIRTSPGPETDIRPGATSSRIGQMFACDALSIAVMQRDPRRSRRLLAASRSAVGSLH